MVQQRHPTELAVGLQALPEVVELEKVGFQ